jgi:3-phenylpropionate/trans-cinnamate dioxygenase ferredoxin subunit
MPTVTSVPLDELADCSAKRVEVDGHRICLVRIGGDVYAIGDRCSHADVSLSEGEVLCQEREIECWKHGSTFSLESGEPLTLPATQPVPVYSAHIVGDAIVVELD